MQITPPAGLSTSAPPWAVGMDMATIAEALENTTNIIEQRASSRRARDDPTDTGSGDADQEEVESSSGQAEKLC